MSSRPSPFQSPTTGSVPRLPNTKTPASGVPADVPYRSDHVAVRGLKLPMSSFPSPFQSPTTGNAALNWNVPTSAGPADAAERNVHVALLGVNAPTPDAISFRVSSVSMKRPLPRDDFCRIKITLL